MSIGNFGPDAERREEETSARSFSTRSFSSRDLATSENSNHQSAPSISSERSVVAGRFMNMIHAHDDARAMFLLAHQPRTR